MVSITARQVITSVKIIRHYSSEVLPTERVSKIAPEQSSHVSSVPKLFGRQKHVEQTTPLTSPISICQVTPATSQQVSSDQSSSPAVSSMSSQLTSTENGEHAAPRWQYSSAQQQMIAPTVERLLPIGTVASMLDLMYAFEKTI